LRRFVAALFGKEVQRKFKGFVDVHVAVLKVLIFSQTPFEEANVLAQLFDLDPLGSDFLLVLDHESVGVNHFVDFDLVQHLLRFAVLKLKAVHLESKNRGKLLDPVNFLRLYINALFLCEVLNRRSVLAVPHRVEVFAARNVEQNVRKRITHLLGPRLTIFLLKIKDGFQFPGESASKLVFWLLLFLLFFNRHLHLHHKAAFLMEARHSMVVLGLIVHLGVATIVA